MISLPLFRMECRRAWPCWLAALLLLYAGGFGALALYDIDRIGWLDRLAAAWPELCAMLGLDGPTGTLVRFLATTLYGCLMLLLPLVYILPAAGRLMAGHTGGRSMGYLLAAPVGRRRVAATQQAVLWTGILTLWLLAGGGIALGAVLLYPGELEMGWYLLLHLDCLAVWIMMAGLCFFVSCHADRPGRYLAVSGELLALFYLLRMLGRLGGQLAAAGWLTPLSLFDPTGIVMGEETWPLVAPLLLLAAGVLFMRAGAAHFRRRDLPL